jgi:hypothetical protein
MSGRKLDKGKVIGIPPPAVQYYGTAELICFYNYFRRALIKILYGIG